MSEGLTGSDIEAISKKAAMAAIRESIQKKGAKKLQISRQHFYSAFKELQSTR
jgi:SpoVK/Ycf46/Vps4 family AAA+-type ATPase